MPTIVGTARAPFTICLQFNLAKSIDFFNSLVYNINVNKGSRYPTTKRRKGIETMTNREFFTARVIPLVTTLEIER